MAKGWFADSGIDIQHEDGNGSTTTVPLVATKKFDLGWGDLSTMAIGRGKGMKVTSVMGLLRRTQLGILVPADSGIATPKDLEGKTVLYTATSVEGPYLDAFFKAGGTSRDKVTLVNVDATAKMSAYAAGQGMGVATTIPFGLPLVNPSRPSKAIEFANYGFVLPGYGMYVHEDTLLEKRDLIGKVVQVMIRAWGEIIKPGGAEEAADLMLKQRPDAKLDRAQAIDQIKQHIPYLYTEATTGKPLGWQALEDWTKTVVNLESAGLIPRGSAPTDYFTNQLIQQ
jgi:NitT/TauT family transport system substrate-binding protein